jgi:hypothetical protein
MAYGAEGIDKVRPFMPIIIELGYLKKLEWAVFEWSVDMLNRETHYVLSRFFDTPKSLMKGNQKNLSSLSTLIPNLKFFEYYQY